MAIITIPNVSFVYKVTSCLLNKVRKLPEATGIDKFHCIIKVGEPTLTYSSLKMAQVFEKQRETLEVFKEGFHFGSYEQSFNNV